MIAAPANVDFRILKKAHMNYELSLLLRAAAIKFMEDSITVPGIDGAGYFAATTEAMEAALNGNGELWIGTMGGDLVIYILACISDEVDRRPAYWVSQAWVREDQRGQPWVKEVWQTIRKRAAELSCKHVVAMSTRRNNEAYCRFLGRGWHVYGTLLKEDL